MKLFTAIARELDRVARCKAGNHPALDNAESCLASLLARMPSGSGFDSGVKLDRDQSTVDRLVFACDFHHMVDGYYDGWTEHRAIVRPSLLWGFDLRITGRNRNEIKDYIAETLECVLNEDVDGPVKPAQIDESEETKRGKLIVDVLSLKQGKDGRIQTAWGDKTELGLFRTMARLVNEGK